MLRLLRLLLGREPEPVKRLRGLERRDAEVRGQATVALTRVQRILAEYRKAEVRRR